VRCDEKMNRLSLYISKEDDDHEQASFFPTPRHVNGLVGVLVQCGVRGDELHQFGHIQAHPEQSPVTARPAALP
jgi:hypothetical protein